MGSVPFPARKSPSPCKKVSPSPARRSPLAHLFRPPTNLRRVTLALSTSQPLPVFLFKNFRSYTAAQSGHVEVARILREFGAEVTFELNGWTLLHEPASNIHVEIVRILCEFRAEANVKDMRGWALLHYFAADKHMEKAEFFVSLELK